MPDPLRCAHLPTTGRVYRIRVAEVHAGKDAPLSDHLVCARCHGAAIGAVALQPSRGEP